MFFVLTSWFILFFSPVLGILNCFLSTLATKSQLQLPSRPFSKYLLMFPYSTMKTFPKTPGCLPSDGKSWASLWEQGLHCSLPGWRDEARRKTPGAHGTTHEKQIPTRHTSTSVNFWPHRTARRTKPFVSTTPLCPSYPSGGITILGTPGCVPSVTFWRKS